MQLTPFEWTVLVAVAGLAVGAIAYFVKGVLKKPEKHESEINQMRGEFAKKETVRLLGEKVQRMQQEYPQQFATKADLKELRQEVRQDTAKLARDIEEIKDNYLTKADFLSNMRKTEDRVEKIYDILVKGGPHSG